MIKVKGIHKSFGTQIVLDGINLEIPQGQSVAVVGPSGTGKSVLLKIISGLLAADTGEITVNDNVLTVESSEEARRQVCSTIGVLFQGAALIDSLNLFENVAFPLRYRKQLSESEIEKRSLDGLAKVGLKGYHLALPGEVSIGMRKRVGIARALVTQPNTILFDEPNTGLDPQTGQEIYDLIHNLHQTSGFTGIVISHEIPEVFQVCSRVVMLYGGQVHHDGTVESFLSSQNPVVKQFVTGSVTGPIVLS